MVVVSLDMLWDEIDKLSDQIHQLADEKAWDELSGLHAQRQQLIVRLTRINKDPESLRTRLANLLEGEKKLLAQCDAEKQNVSQQLLDLRRGRQVARSYSQS